MEGMYSRREHLGKQGEFEECNRIGRRVQESVPQGRRRGSKVTRD